MMASSPKPAPSMIQLGYRVILTVVLVALVFMGLWLWDAWHKLERQELARMRTTADLAAGHSEHYFEQIGNQMEFLAEALQEKNIYLSPAAHGLLANFKRKNPDVGGVSVILPNGAMILSTVQPPGLKLPNIHADPEWSTDFVDNLKQAGFSVNRPQFGYMQKRWLILLRYTVMDKKGQPLFVLQTSLPLEKQQTLWRNLRLKESEAIGLLHENGYLISRIPTEDPAKLYRTNNWRGPLIQAIYKTPDQGMFDGVTMTGESRIGSYRRLTSLPLYAFVSVPKADVWRQWWLMVRLPASLLVVFLIIAVAAYLVLARNFAIRMRRMRRELETVDADYSGRFPSSGVREIDTFYQALTESQLKLRRSAQNREKLLLAAANAGTYTVRLKDDVIIQADAVFLDMVGMTADELLGSRFSVLTCGPEDCKTAEAAKQTLFHRIISLRHKNGSEVWVSTAEYIDKSREPVRNGLAINVSERERLLSTVRSHSARLQTLWQLETRRSISADQKISLLLRLGLDTLQMETALIGEVKGEHYILRHVEDQLGWFSIGSELKLSDTLCHYAIVEKTSLFLANLNQHPRFCDHPTLVQHGIHVYVSIPIWVAEEVFGTLVFLRRKPLPPFNDDDRAFAELLAAWYGQLCLEQKQRGVLESLAMTDSLTQLWNRRAAEIQFQSEISRAQRSGETFAVGLCDIDHFKLVNDHYGHEVGDSVLSQVAQIMRSTLREGDWVARWGGEEFIIFMHQSNSHDAYTVMERLRMAVKTSPIRIGPNIIEITISIGIGVSRLEENDIARVLSEADGCVYDAKKQGRDRVATSEGGNRTLWRAGMLQSALQEKRLVPAYQGIVDFKDNQLVADESLARIVLPDGKILPAKDFIEAAEGINLIHLVDDVIAKQAMERCRDNILGGLEPTGFIHFVNLSPQFLARNDMVESLLEFAKLTCQNCDASKDVKSIVFEITERHFLGDFTNLRRDLKPLLDFGFRLALDDFGSGYSSFLYLAELPISFIKIEGWMVRNMRASKNVLEMVRSIIQLAQTLKIATIAECVEDKETATLLKELGVDLGQGHYFSHPTCAYVFPSGEIGAAQRLGANAG